MTQKNPFVRMNWLQRAPHLVQEDVAHLQSELRKLYPEMVIFPRSYHFHELGEEVRKPVFIDDMVEHFQPWIEPERRWGYRSGDAVAIRIPWAEELASGNSQRLIGRPYRRPYDDPPEAFRRFGRTAYFGVRSTECFTGITIDVPPALILPYCAPGVELAPFSLLAEDVGFDVEMPHDTGDEEVVAFVKSVTSIANRLGSSTYCHYDLVTGEPLFIMRGQPMSRSFLRKCTFQPHLYCSLALGTYNGHPIVEGPTPSQRRKWRREAGLGDDPSLQNPPILSWPDFSRHYDPRLQRYPDAFFSELRRLKDEAFFRYMRDREERVGSGASRPHQL